MKQAIDKIANEDWRLEKGEIEKCWRDYHKAISEESMEELSKASKTNGQYIANDQKIECQEEFCKLCRFSEAIQMVKAKEETKTEARNAKLCRKLTTLNNMNVCFKLHQKQNEDKDPWLTAEEMNTIREAVNRDDKEKILRMTEKQTVNKRVDIMQYANHVVRENEEKIDKQIEKTRKEKTALREEWLAKTKMEEEMKQSEKETEETIAEAKQRVKQKRTMLEKIQDNINKAKLPIQLDEPTPANGNCGPETVLQQLNRPELAWYNKVGWYNKMWNIQNKVKLEKRQEELRKRIKQFVEEEEKNKPQLAILRRNYELQVEPWQEYWNRMEKPGVWVDYYWWNCIAMFMELDIIVIHEQSTEENPYFIIEGHHNRPKTDDPEPFMIIAYQDNHFQSLLPTQLKLTEDWIEEGKKRAKPWPEEWKAPKMETSTDNDDANTIKVPIDFELELMTLPQRVKLVKLDETSEESQTTEKTETGAKDLQKKMYKMYESNSDDSSTCGEYQLPSNEESPMDTNETKQDSEQDNSDDESKIDFGNIHFGRYNYKCVNKCKVEFKNSESQVQIKNSASQVQTKNSASQIGEGIEEQKFKTQLEIIQGLPHVTIKLLDREFTALVDTGASISMMPMKHVLAMRRDGRMKFFRHIKATVLGCDDLPVKIEGVAVFPNITIGKQELNKQIAFYVSTYADTMILQGNILEKCTGTLSYQEGAHITLNKPAGDLINRDLRESIKEALGTAHAKREQDDEDPDLEEEKLQIEGWPDTMESSEDEEGEEWTEDWSGSESDNPCEGKVCAKLRITEKPKWEKPNKTKKIILNTKSNDTIRRGTTKQFRMQRNHSKTLEEWMQEAKQDLIHVEIKDQHKLSHPCCIIQKQSSPKNEKTYYNLIMSNFSTQDMKLSNKLIIRKITAKVNKVRSTAEIIADTARTVLKGKQDVDQEITQTLSKPEVPKESKEQGFLEKIVTNRQYQDRMKNQTGNISDLARNSRIHIDYKKFKIKFPQYPKAGRAAINQDSDTLTIFLQYTLMHTAFQMKLDSLTKSEIRKLMGELKRIKPVETIQRKMEKARKNLNLAYLYQKAPLEIICQYYIALANNTKNMTRIETSRLQENEMQETLVKLQKRGEGQTVELALMTLYNLKLIEELAEEWGIQPATLGQELDFEPRLVPIDPREVRRMPEDLRRQVRESAISDEELREQNITRLFNTFIAKQKGEEAKHMRKGQQKQEEECKGCKIKGSLHNNCPRDLFKSQSESGFEKQKNESGVETQKNESGFETQESESGFETRKACLVTLKKESELIDIVNPVTEGYDSIHPSLEEAFKRNMDTCDNINKEAEEKAKHEAQQDQAKFTNAAQLEKFMSYLKSGAAMEDFFKQQTGEVYMEHQIPRAEYVKNMRRVEWVHYQTTEEVIDDLIPVALQDQFDKYFTLVKDPDMQELARVSPVPDLPRLDFFDHESTEPSPLYDVDLGIVKPSYLAFLTANLFTPENPITKYPILFTQMAANCFMLGNFINATHGSSAGTFDRRTFLTRSHLEPTMGPPKSLTINQVNHEDPDIADYIEGQVWLNKMMQVTASPFQNTLRSIPKKRAPARTIEFPENSAVLRHLLNLQGLDTEEVRRSKEEFMKGKKTLAEDFQAFDEETWNNAKVQQEKKEATETKEVKNKVNKVKQRGFEKVLKERKQVKGDEKASTETTRNWGDWDISSIKVKDISRENQAYRDYNLPSSMETVRKGLQRKYRRQNGTRGGKPKEKKVTWAESVRVEYRPENLEQNGNIDQRKCFWTEYHNNLFETSEDGQLYKIIEFCQEVGTSSKNLLEENHKEKYNIANRRKEQEIPVRWLLGEPTSKQMEIGKENGNMLTNVRVLDKLAEDLAGKHRANMIGKDHEEYDIVFRIAENSKEDRRLDVARACMKTKLHEEESTQNMLKAMERINMLSMEDEVRNPDCENPNLEEALGRILIPQEADSDQKLLSYMAMAISDSVRIAERQGPYNMNSKRESIEKQFVNNILPEEKNWKTVTIKEAVRRIGLKNMLERIADNLGIPILLVQGQPTQVKPRIGKARASFRPNKILTVGQPKKEKKEDIAVLAIDEEANQIFKVHISDNDITTAVMYKLTNDKAEELEIPELIKMIQKEKQGRQEDQELRYIPSTLQFINMKIYKKRKACRIITNSRATNKHSRAVATYLQSYESIQKILAAGHSYTGVDLTQCFLQLPCDPLSSFINCGIYRGLQYVPLCTTMGATQSCLYATTLNQTLTSNINDDLVLQKMVKPRKADHTPLAAITLPPMTSKETYHIRAPLGRPGNDAAMRRIQEEIDGKREEIDYHPFNMTEEQRHAFKLEGDNHQIVDDTAMIDDIVLTITNLIERIPVREENREEVILSMHVLLQKQLMLNLYQCSDRNEKEFTPAKINLRKSTFASKAISFVGRVFTRGKEIINWSDFKKRASALDTLPQNGKELAGTLSFLNYFSQHIPKLQYFAHPLRELLKTHPQLTKINWKEFPKTEQCYRDLVEASRQFSGIEVMPSDLNAIHSVIISSDASNSCIAYNVGIAVRPTAEEAEKSKKQGKEPRATLKLLKNYSVIIQDNLKRAPISAKETISAVVALNRETELLREVNKRDNIKKYLLVDNTNLIHLAAKVAQNEKLGNHFYAHPRLKEYVTSLANMCELHNIKILGVASQLQLADTMTRRDAETKMCAMTTTKTCEACENCKKLGILVCRRTISHAGCPFGIENIQEEENKLNLLEYEQEKNAVLLDGKEVKYTTGYKGFDREKYVELDLSRFKEQMNVAYSPVNLQEYIRNREEQEEKMLTREDVINYYQDEKRKIVKLRERNEELREQTRNGEKTEAEKRKLEKKRKRVNMIRMIRKPDPRQARLMRSHVQINTPSHLHRRYNTICYPNHPMVFLATESTTIYNKYPTEKEQKEGKTMNLTTIVLFIGEREKGVGTKNKFLKKITKHAVLNEDRRPLEAKFYMYEGQRYILSTNPKEQTETGTVKKSMFLKQLQRVFNKVEEQYHKDQEKTEIAFVGQLMEQTYNIPPEYITTAIVLQQKRLEEFTKAVGVYSNNIGKIIPNWEEQIFEKEVHLLVNEVFKGAINLQLDARGQQKNILDTIKEKERLRLNPEIKIVYDFGAVTPASSLNLVTARQIQINYKRKPKPWFVRMARNMEVEAKREEWYPFSAMAESRTRIQIEQEKDPRVRAIKKQIQEHQGQTLRTTGRKQMVKQGKIEFKLNGELVMGRRQKGDEVECQFRPLCPEAIVQTELLAIHVRYNHINIEETRRKFQEQWFYKPPYCGERGQRQLAKAIIPCLFCRLAKDPQAMRGQHLYAERQNLVLNLNGLSCAVWGHDVFYAKGDNIGRIRRNQVSLIVCMGCNYVSAKTVPSGASHHLAMHVLEQVNSSGYPPLLLVHDTARNEMFGAMRDQLKGLNKVINEINLKRIGRQKEEKGDSKSKRKEKAMKEEGEDGETIDNIGENRKRELQKYIDYTCGDEAGPLLRRPMRVHQPTANNSSHPRQATSLGTVDAACKALKRYIAQNIMDLEAPCKQEELDLIIASFVIHNNIYKTSYKTKKAPVLIHHQPTRGEDQRQWTKELATTRNQEEAEQLSIHQKAASMAREHKEAEENRLEQDRKDKERWRTKQHPGAVNVEKIIETYQPLTILSVRTDDQDKKMSQKYATTAPWIVLYPLIEATEELYMMHLYTGETKAKHVRNVIKVIPVADILGSPMIWDYLRTSRRMEITDRANNREVTPRESLEYIETITYNIMQAVKFLAPLIPTLEEANEIARELDGMTKTDATEEDSEEADTDEEEEQKKPKQVRFNEPHKAYEGKQDPEEQPTLGRTGSTPAEEGEEPEPEPEEHEERKEEMNKEEEDETTRPRRSRRNRRTVERYQDDWGRGKHIKETSL